MGGGGGGAWKVAYADFVTAMMALFMVLWISAQDEEILIATSRYFRSPFNSPMDRSMGVMPEESTTLQSGSEGTGSENAPSNVIDNAFLQKLAQEFFRLLNLDEKDENKSVSIRVVSDGIRITLYERNAQPIFEENGDQFTEWGGFVIQNLSWLIDRYEFQVRIAAHSRSSDNEDVDPWKLSSNRAVSTREKLVHYALDPGKVERLSGFGDSKPLEETDAYDRRNDRLEISLVVTK